MNNKKKSTPSPTLFKSLWQWLFEETNNEEKLSAITMQKIDDDIKF